MPKQNCDIISDLQSKLNFYYTQSITKRTGNNGVLFSEKKK